MPRRQTCIDCGKPLDRLGTAALCVGCAQLHRRAHYRRKNATRRTAMRMKDVPAQYELQLRRQAKRCPLCSTKLVDQHGQPASKELDHIIPIGIGGTHTIGNVRIICRACNARRPGDGSDFVGQPTLWSQDLVFASTLPVKVRAPKCACGRRLRAGRCGTCHPVERVVPVARGRPADGRAAAEMRAEGHTWQAIADRLGFGSAGSAYASATRFGAADVVERWPRNRGQLSTSPWYRARPGAFL